MDTRRAHRRGTLYGRMAAQEDDPLDSEVGVLEVVVGVEVVWV